MKYVRQRKKNTVRSHLMWNMKTKQDKNSIKFVDTANRLVVARGGGWEVGEIGEESQKVQTSSYRVNKP